MTVSEKLKEEKKLKRARGIRKVEKAQKVESRWKNQIELSRIEENSQESNMLSEVERQGVLTGFDDLTSLVVPMNKLKLEPKKEKE